MKKFLMCLVCCTFIVLIGCVQREQTGEEPKVPSSQSTELDTSAATAEQNTIADAEAEQLWPDVVPLDTPVLSGVIIEGYYPHTANEREYVINFTIDKENVDLVMGYIKTLSDAGFVESYHTENHFGFDYAGSNEKYDVFINVVYDNSSRLSITVK